jgi:capsular exopolysaccharide synthesis family protein
MLRPNSVLTHLCQCSRVHRRIDPHYYFRKELIVSQIFDALQRSESERSGIDTATLPQGPDLLRRAERAAASTWVTSSAGVEPDVSSVAVDDERIERTVIPISPTGASSQIHFEDQLTEPGLDVLGGCQTLEISIPPQSRLVCLTDRENPTAEAIRLLGVRLKDLRQTRPLKKVLITSTIPQEGKSMISANLACVLAHGSDTRVLLMEGDLRRPSLSHMFGVQKQRGIYEWLREGGDPINNIYRLKDAGLWMFPAGDASSNPIELLQSQSLPALMDRIAAWFDWIIIDSPPVLPLADTSVWMRLADGVLLVTRQGTTEKQQLTRGLEALETDKLIGAVVNGSMASAYSGYYYRSTISS